jgi:hypothetical protein
MTAMHAFLDVCSGDFASAATTADTILQCTDVDDFSAMLAATVTTIAAGELGRADELA